MDTERRRFERLVRPVLDDLFRFARRLTRDPVSAEDLLQQALIRGMSRVSQLQDDGAFKVWQSRVLYTTWCNNRQRRSDMPIEAHRLEPNVVPLDPEARLAARQLGSQIAIALDELPADQREAVWLVDGQGFKYAEAASILEVAPGTVASRVARGRITLRMSLADVAADEGVRR